MTLYATMAGGAVVLTDERHGKPVEDTPAPEPEQGFEYTSRWEDQGDAIRRVWEKAPAEGTELDAAVRLARAQALSLPDAEALDFAALFPEWEENADYSDGDRVRRSGALWRCLSAHCSQYAWSPEDSPSLWAKVLANPDGVAEWEQPGATNPYAKGDRVTHAGKTWESLVEGNVWEPGAPNTGELWREVGAA